VANHFEAHRLHFDNLADVFAQMLKFATTVRAARLMRRDRLRFAREMRAKLAPRLGNAWSALFGGLLVQLAGALRSGCLEILDQQLQLLDLERALFAALPKLHAAQLKKL
jgi:hypothetical protein